MTAKSLNRTIPVTSKTRTWDAGAINTQLHPENLGPYKSQKNKHKIYGWDVLFFPVDYIGTYENNQLNISYTGYS